jgi:hypothetical protein
MLQKKFCLVMSQVMMNTMDGQMGFRVATTQWPCPLVHAHLLSWW